MIGIEYKILAFYAKVLSTSDIFKTLEDIYGLETSYEMISAFTDKVIPLIQDRRVFRRMQTCLKSFDCESEGAPLTRRVC